MRGAEYYYCFLLLLFCFLIFEAASSDLQKWEAIEASAEPKVQREEVLQLLERIKTDLSSAFEITVDPKVVASSKNSDFVSLEKSSSDKIKVLANSGVSAAWGIHHYLKYFCGCHFSWDTSRIDVALESMPLASFNLTSNEKFRYYQNVCTPGYTFAFWQWPQWEPHIDWMALNGVNMPLAFTAQEAIWARVYEKFGLSESDLAKHFSGPAFLPWQRMGNMEAFGGPLSRNWHNFTIKLQHQILARMRNLGMTPVLPAFAGHIPQALIDKYPNVSFTKQNWNGFPPTYLLDANEALFKEIGTAFMAEYAREFGTDHLYNCDTFNEMDPISNDPGYIRETGKAIFSAMESHDPQAVWVMQGWLFHYAQDFWQAPQIKAILSSVPSGAMIVLDLDSTLNEQFTRTESYYGLQPFIFNDLNNFGGSLGLYGRFDNINEWPQKARNLDNSTMIGTGFTPEGLTDSYITTELMSEMSWRSGPVENLTHWIEQYTQRRYGKLNHHAVQAWIKLRSHVLNSKTRHFNQLVFLTKMPTLNGSDFTWYNLTEVAEAWDDMIVAISELRDESGFMFDIVDITRQVLANLAAFVHQHAIKALNEGDFPVYIENMGLFFQLLWDLDDLLCSHDKFLLGTWLDLAKNIEGATPEESHLYEFNARNQVTLWGPRGEILDYAAKQWCGLVRDYYGERWQLLHKLIVESYYSQQPFNQTEFHEVFIDSIGIPFTLDRKVYPTQPYGNSVKIVMEIFDFWRPLVDDFVAKSFQVADDEYVTVEIL